jgi:cytochrome c oxidase cbb3-type subunit III
MSFRDLVLGIASLSAFVLGGCSGGLSRPSTIEVPIVPGDISDFKILFAQNCSGCHGPEGKGGAAIALSDPVYLAVADDAVVRRAAANGIAGTAMPAFAQSAGGMLTSKQIDLIVSGIRERWSKPDAVQGASAPPYSSPEPGNPSRGSEVYATYCSSCHGAGGRGGEKASSIVDGSFLALLNDQELRTIVIVGRPELGAPDWRNNVPGKPMSAQDVSDVVAWLASQRPKFPGQPYPSVAKTAGEAP